MASRWFGSSASASRSQPTARALRLCRVVNSERMSRAARNFSSAGLTRSAGPARPRLRTRRRREDPRHPPTGLLGGACSPPLSTRLPPRTPGERPRPRRTPSPASKRTARASPRATSPRISRHREPPKRPAFTLSTGMIPLLPDERSWHRRATEKIPYTRVFDLHQMGP